MLSNELKKMCTSWQHLEEQKTKKIIHLEQKEEIIVQLTLDKSKLETKLNMINKQNTLYNNNMVNKTPSYLNYFIFRLR